MTVEEACKTSGLPKNEAELLLAHILQKNRTWIIAHEDHVLDEQSLKLARDAFADRKRGMPIAHRTGSREFYGRTFAVNASTLIPRQSTEELIDLTLDVLQGKATDEVRSADTEIVVASRLFGDIADVQTIVDIGTGSGCIAITLALETKLRIIGTDVSPQALMVAKENAIKLGASVKFLEGSALEPIMGLREPFLIVSNPPYIPEGTLLTDEVQNFEPNNALFGGSDGCAILRVIAEEARNHPYCRGLIVECREEQPDLCFPTDAERSTLTS